MVQKRARAKAGMTALEARQDLILGRPPRIPVLTSEAAVKGAAELTTRLRRAVLPNAPELKPEHMPEIMPTLMCHPDLWERVAMVSMQLLGKGALTRRDAELAVLRTAWLCGAPFEWGEHVEQAKNAGLTAKEIERVIEGAGARGWNARDRAILRAAEELHVDAMVSDAVWKALSKHFDNKQLFELLVLIGQFTMVAYFQNSLRLRPPSTNRGLHAR